MDSQSLQKQFEKIRSLTTLSHVMQWGDTSFVDDAVSQYIGGRNKIGKAINLRKPILGYRPSTSFDSRLMKIKILTETFKREKTVEAHKEMREELIDMQMVDTIFFTLIQNLGLKGEYSPRHMNYDCMRTVMDNHT